MRLNDILLKRCPELKEFYHELSKLPYGSIAEQESHLKNAEVIACYISRDRPKYYNLAKRIIRHYHGMIDFEKRYRRQ